MDLQFLIPKHSPTVFFPHSLRIRVAALLSASHSALRPIEAFNNFIPVPIATNFFILRKCGCHFWRIKTLARLWEKDGTTSLTFKFSGYLLWLPLSYKLIKADVTKIDMNIWTNEYGHGQSKKKKIRWSLPTKYVVASMQAGSTGPKKLSLYYNAIDSS